MKLLTLTAIALLTFGSVNAQTATDTPSGTATVQESRGDLMKEVGLTADQMERMKASDLRYSEAANALSTSTMDRDAKVQQSQELREQHTAEIKAIMTPEQYAKMKELRTEKRAASTEQRQQRAPQHNE